MLALKSIGNEWVSVFEGLQPIEWAALVRKLKIQIIGFNQFGNG